MEQRTDPTTTRRPAPAGLLALLVVGLGLLTAGCGSSSDAATAAGVDVGTPRHGGTVWMETAQEPPVLNSFLGAGGMSITEVVTAPLKSTWIQVDDHGVWQPLLATSVPTLANGGVVRTPSGGVQLAFDIQPAAVWSDREPITCQDLRFTWRTVMNPKWAIGSRIGWERIQRIDCPTPKRVRMVLDRPYAPYLSALLATAPLPQHALQGRDFNSVWNNRITVSSGPFVFDRWERGDRITMRRNPNWWRAGPEQKPYVDRLVVRFVADTASLKLDLRMGDADIVGIPPDTNLAKELKSIPDARFVVLPGAGWENLTFNTGRFPFDDARVRRAVAFAVDRDSLVDVALDHQVPRLDSTLLPYQAPYYRPSFDRYRADHAQVDVRMQAAGWTRPEGGSWTSPEGRVAKLVLTTTSGNPIRLKAVQLIGAQLEQAGFRTEILPVKPEVFFGSVVSRGNFDLAMYSYTQGMDPSQSKLFSCSEIARTPDWTGKNNAKYCNRDLDRILAAGDRELDPQRRSALVHDADEILMTDVPTLPLYQQPDTLAWNRRVHGVRPNAMGRHLWNIDSWWVDE